MIQTIITPQKTKFDITVSLPDDYVGKEVHVLFYIDQKVKKVLTNKRPSDFFGTLSKEDGEKVQTYVARGGKNGMKFRIDTNTFIDVILLEKKYFK